MQFVTAATMKLFDQLAIGELCHVLLGTNPAFAFPIAKDGSRALIAILKLGEVVRPMVHEVRNLRTKCLSYGTEWTLQAEIDNQSIPPGGHAETPGSIHLHSGGATMYLAPFSQESMMEGHQLALPDLSYGSIPHDNAFAILKWKIWASQADLTRVGGVPLIQFDHGAQQ